MVHDRESAATDAATWATLVALSDGYAMAIAPRDVP